VISRRSANGQIFGELDRALHRIERGMICKMKDYRHVRAPSSLTERDELKKLRLHLGIEVV
jgi:hypothetical protein